MPSIQLFGVKTLFAGDDLHFGALVTAILRCGQLVLLLPLLAHIGYEARRNGGLRQFLSYDTNVTVDGDCQNAHLFGVFLLTYAMASGVYGLASLVLEHRITYWSGVGTPTDTVIRTPKVTYLLEVRLLPFPLILFVILVCGFAAVWFAPNYYECKDLEAYEAWVQNQLGEDPTQGDNESISFLDKIKLWGVGMFFLLFSQVSEVFVAWLFLLHLWTSPRPEPPVRSASSGLLEETYHNHELVEQMWADRCAAACQCLGVASCFTFGGRQLLGQAEFGDVARAMADYLETRGVLDVVPSDIVMGFLILQRLQVERSMQTARRLLGDVERRSSQQLFVESSNSTEDDNFPLSTSSKDDLLIPFGPSTDDIRPEHNESEPRRPSLLLHSSSEDMMALSEGARYADYALAIYTWVLYMYVHPVTGFPRLASSAGMSCFASLCGAVDEQGRIEGDNMCQSHKTALLLTAGLDNADLVYAQLRSSFTENPYCILLDHEWKSVVVSIRGTFSLEDCVTDVLIEPEPLDQLGEEYGFDGAGQFCHGGVMLCARNIYRDLQRHGLLDQLLSGPNARYPSYTLRFVGHSLGASTCTILSYMLKSKFPNLKCITYSPPGWSLTWEAATGCHGWCTSFVLDSDIVPRLSQRSLEVLRDEILDLIGRVKVPKIEVVNRYLSGVGAVERALNDGISVESIEDILYRPDEVPDSDYQRQLATFRAIQEDRRRSRGTARSVKMYPPGRLIHLAKTHENTNFCHTIVKCLTCFTTNAGFAYTPVSIGNDELDEIVVVPHMGTDHFPNRMSSVIRSVAASYGLDC